jgi:energy-coupling factor transporter ATP-binding protein EcfA2
MRSHIQAHYTKHPVAQFNGNPLTEALPAPMRSSDILHRAGRAMQCDTDYWALDSLYQRAILQSMGDTHIPSDKFITFYQKCWSLLLHSYAYRNPLEPDAMALKMGLAAQYRVQSQAKVDQPIKRSVASHKTTASSVLVTGYSGAGKTTMIRSALSLIPQVIYHHEFEGKPYHQNQIVWVSLDMPSTPSLKALALNFFRAVDDATGNTDYFEQWDSRNRESVDRHLTGMQLVAATHEIGLVHIDELQFLLAYGKSDKAPTLTILEAMFNKIGIPMIISCTDSGLQLFSKHVHVCGKSQPEITTLRRLVNDREFRLATYSRDGELFLKTLKALYPEWSLLNCTQLSTEFITTFYEYTCGLPAFMTRLAQVHQEYLVYLSHEGELAPDASTNTIIYLNTVFSSQFQLYKMALKHLKSKNIRDYEDAIAAAQQAQHTQTASPMSKMQAKAPRKAPANTSTLTPSSTSTTNSSPRAPILAPVLEEVAATGPSMGSFNTGIKD